MESPLSAGGRAPYQASCSMDWLLSGHERVCAPDTLKRHATEPRPARTSSSQPTSEFTYPTPFPAAAASAGRQQLLLCPRPRRPPGSRGGVGGVVVRAALRRPVGPAGPP